MRNSLSVGVPVCLSVFAPPSIAAEFSLTFYSEIRSAIAIGAFDKDKQRL